MKSPDQTETKKSKLDVNMLVSEMIASAWKNTWQRWMMVAVAVLGTCCHRLGSSAIYARADRLGAHLSPRSTRTACSPFTLQYQILFLSCLDPHTHAAHCAPAGYSGKRSPVRRGTGSHFLCCHPHEGKTSQSHCTACIVPGAFPAPFRANGLDRPAWVYSARSVGSDLHSRQTTSGCGLCGVHAG